MSRTITPPPTYEQTTFLKPYLELPHILSLTWLAYPILSLIFIAFRMQISLESSQDAIASAKDTLLASCKAAENAATGAVSMPRYLAIASNEQFADAVNATLRGARATLILALTAMEAIINFLIDLYRSTFLCFLELVVRGGLSIIISAVQEFNDFITGTFSGLRTSIQNDIAAANNVIQGAVDAFNKINPFGDVTIPPFDIPSLSGLQNVQLPSTFQDALIKLNDTLPTVDEIKAKMEAIIDTPFELVKKEINDTFANLTFDASVLPVPQQNTVLFCADMDTSIVDDLGRDIIKAAKIGLGIIIGLIVLLIAANCALQWYKWRTLQSHLEYTRQAWQNDPTIYHPGSTEKRAMPSMAMTNHNLMVLENTMSNPLITRCVNQVSRLFRLSPTTHINLQWFFSYIFHTPALTVFLIGFFGLLSVQLQLLALGPLEAKYKEQTAASVAQFSNTIATSVNNSMYNQSAAYANDVNQQIAVMQQQLDGGVFGWINTTTVELNTTISTFYSNVEGVVNDVFGGTILETPAKEFLRCILGTKIDAIENALTFLHDNVQIQLPKMNETVLVLSPQVVDETTRPIALAAIGGGEGGDNDEGGIVGKIVNTYAKTLRQERLMFAIFLGIWGVVVLMGIAVLLWHSFGKRWFEGIGRRRWEREQRSGINGVVVPFRVGAPEASITAPHLPSFSPLPPPQKSLPVDEEQPWDSFFGQKKQTQPELPQISRPMKLMAAARERFKGSDSDTGSQRGPARTTVFARLFGPKSSPPSPKRQPLKINVQRAESMSPSFNIQIEQGEDPVSAWSSSPSPHNRPSDVATLRKSPIPPAAPAPSIPLPLHQSFANATPLNGPRHPALAGAGSGVQSNEPDSASPVSKLLSKTHARRSSSVGNPFDDGYAAPRNPFSPVAL